MNTDEQGYLKKEENLLFAEETRTILQLSFQVMNTLGHGFREKTYENALVHLLKKNNIPFNQQARFNIMFDGVKVDEFIPDLIVNDNIIVDLKTIERITNNEIGQMINYLRATELKLALIINFKHSKLEYRRVSL